MRAIPALVNNCGSEKTGVASRWSDRTGKRLILLSLEIHLLHALQAELEATGAAVKEGHWGCRLTIVCGPDGNELYFPYPGEEATPPWQVTMRVVPGR